MEHEEYTSENYPTSGKKYNNEKAIISLTSWKARINTVSKTIFSLIKQCPGFHIVLCLSEEEFPQKEAELPNNLMLFVENNLIEILWVYKNYKSFKKVLFTMDKYRDVPIISADDDFIYRWNYAEKLYNLYKKHNTMVSCTASYKLGKVWPHGYAVLYPPSSLLYENIQIPVILSFLLKNKCIHDDGLLARLYYKNKKHKMAKSLNLNWPDVCTIHTIETKNNGISRKLTQTEANREYNIINSILKL